MKQIYLAGGCFWGTEKYFSNIYGVEKTEVGYANGKTQNPTYEDVCHNNTGHAETVKILYNPEMINLNFLLKLYFDIIDPTSINKQGGDIGSQYRTGIYYIEESDKPLIIQSIQELQKKYKNPIAIEVKVLENYYPAEEYHQKYLDKNPQGYCHIKKKTYENAQQARPEKIQYVKQSKEILKQILTPIQYEVTQNKTTEPPFKNEYYDNHEQGIYVAITTGEALFVSSDKFDSGCGWPSFSKPIDKKCIQELTDTSHGMKRTEVRTKNSNIHLGHVFEDGPIEFGGLRYCINSASLRFIPQEKMEQEGYGQFISLIQ